MEQSQTIEDKTIIVDTTENHTTGDHTNENHTIGDHTRGKHSMENAPNDTITHAESERKNGKVKICRLKVAGPKKTLHTVYIGGLDYHTSEDALRAHLIDLNVDNIRNVSKLVQNVSDCSTFKVIISADSIKQSVYGEAKFSVGVIVKPFRFYNPDNSSYSRNQTTHYCRSPLGARRFTNNTCQQSRAHSVNRQPLLNDPQPLANAMNNYSLQQKQQNMPLKNPYHYNQTPDQSNAQQHNNYMQQHNLAPQVPSQQQYDTVQPTNLTQQGQHHVSTLPRSNAMHTYVDTTRNLQVPPLQRIQIYNIQPVITMYITSTPRYQYSRHMWHH